MNGNRGGVNGAGPPRRPGGNKTNKKKAESKAARLTAKSAAPGGWLGALVTCVTQFKRLFHPPSGHKCV